MNTQTHLLLGLAASARRPRDAARAASTPAVGLALLAGASAPDSSPFVMWGRAKLAGVPAERIRGERHYGDFRQGVGAVTNPVPLFALLALVAWLAGGRFVLHGAFRGEPSGSTMEGRARR